VGKVAVPKRVTVDRALRDQQLRCDCWTGPGPRIHVCKRNSQGNRCARLRADRSLGHRSRWTDRWNGGPDAWVPGVLPLNCKAHKFHLSAEVWAGNYPAVQEMFMSVSEYSLNRLSYVYRVRHSASQVFVIAIALCLIQTFPASAQTQASCTFSIFQLNDLQTTVFGINDFNAFA